MQSTAFRDGRNPTLVDIRKTVELIGKSVLAEYADSVDREARFPREAFDALSEARLLSAYVPESHGGFGLSIGDICQICEELGQYCASTAMVFAMHQIQVACLVQHACDTDFFDEYLKELTSNQLLLASATTELGVGGDVRSSKCAVEIHEDHFQLKKNAPVVSYANDADAIMITCRRAPDAAANDQSIVLVKKDDCDLNQISDWDALGFRGTCSCGFTIDAHGNKDQIVATPYAQVLAKTMHPVSHLLWGSLWTGLAASAVETARQVARGIARKNAQVPPVTALRLSEVNEKLFSMRSGLHGMIAEYEQLLARDEDANFEDFGFAIRINNVKISCSEYVVDIVGEALQIVGISGYKNNSDNSLSRHLRDAYGAALMVNNDRIRGHNSTMQIAHKGSK